MNLEVLRPCFFMYLLQHESVMECCSWTSRCHLLAPEQEEKLHPPPPPASHLFIFPVDFCHYGQQLWPHSMKFQGLILSCMLGSCSSSWHFLQFFIFHIVLCLYCILPFVNNNCKYTWSIVCKCKMTTKCMKVLLLWSIIWAVLMILHHAGFE